MSLDLPLHNNCEPEIEGKISWGATEMDSIDVQSLCPESVETQI